jgi:hypothetical protein
LEGRVIVVSVRQLALEMRVDECADRAAWSYAQAAACPWWRFLRRALLVRRARVLEREMDAWAAVLFVHLGEVRPEEPPS